MWYFILVLNAIEVQQWYQMCVEAFRNKDYVSVNGSPVFNMKFITFPHTFKKNRLVTEITKIKL